MSEIGLHASASRPRELPPSSGEDRSSAADDRDDVFELIERTAETMRALWQKEGAVAEREEAWKAKLERDRAAWRGDLEDLRRMVESCLERAVLAEHEAETAETRAKLAIQLCHETRSREAAALERAEAAEERARLAEERARVAEEKCARLKSAFTVDVLGAGRRSAQL